MPNLKNPNTGEVMDLSYDESGMMEAKRLRREGWVDQGVGGRGETAMYKKIKQTGSSPYRMKGTPMQRNFKSWWKGSKLKKDLKIARDIIVKDIKTIEGRVKKVGGKFEKDVKALPGKLGIKKQSPKKHTGSASHPTGAIAAHKGHMSKEMTKKKMTKTFKKK